jgi:large subunit ribosomal protein L22
MDLIRGDPVEQALLKLECSPRRASPMVRKVVLSAVANAAQMGGVEPESLVVHQAFADDGPIMKRWRPRSMGRAFPILKRTSHLSVVVATVERRDAAGSDAGGRQGAQAQSRAEGEARG